jgi:hypothetical protein
MFRIDAGTNAAAFCVVVAIVVVEVENTKHPTSGSLHARITIYRNVKKIGERERADESLMFDNDSSTVDLCTVPATSARDACTVTHALSSSPSACRQIARALCRHHHVQFFVTVNLARPKISSSFDLAS